VRGELAARRIKMIGQTTQKQIESSPVQQGPVETPQPVKPEAPVCVEKPLRTWEWDMPASLKINQATTRHYQAVWNVNAKNCHGQWPRTYDFHADCDGWISDHFVMGGCGQKQARVHWNLETNQALVTGLDGSAVDRGTALEMAKFAKRTIFPGLNLSSI
jgi:hypothetical protein